MSDELRKLRPLMAIISLATVVLLAWFHADLWFGQGAGDESSWRLGLMAILSDFAKVVLFSAGVWLVLSAGRKRVKALGALAVLVSLALVVLSVTGVFGGLQVTGARMIDTAAPDPARVAELSSLATSYADQVESLQRSKDLLPADWYTRRAELDGQMTVAQKGYQSALDLKASIPTRPRAEAAFFAGVATVTGWTDTQARTWVYGSYSVLLELVSLLSTLLAFFGVRLAGSVSASPAKSASTAPVLAEAIAPKDFNPIASQELANRAKIRQAMERYLTAAFQGIEEGHTDAFLGRNKIMQLSGLDRPAVDWCQRLLTTKALVTTTQDPQRTIPIGTREELLVRMFGTEVR